MYCKMCGNLLDDTDLNCKICGAEIEQKEKPAAEEEIVYNPEIPKIPADSEFTWNIHEFQKERKQQDIVFDWGLNTDEENDIEKENEFEAVFFEKPAIKIEPEIESTEIKIEPEIESAEIKFEHQLNKGINLNEISSQALNIDKLFSFNKKNEEYQDVLDKEYDNIRRNTEYNTIFQGEKLGEGEKLEEIELEQIEEAIPGIDIEIQTNVSLNSIKDELIAPPIQSQLKEMSDARASFFKDDIVLDNETIKKMISDEEKAEDAEVLENQTDAEDSSTEDNQIKVKNDNEAVPPIIFPFDYEEEYVEKKKGCLGKGFLILVAIILILEITILGIKYFVPNSAASVYIEETQTKVVNVVTEWVLIIKDLVNGDDSQEPTDKEEPTDIGQDIDDKNSQDVVEKTPDITPTADKSVLISSQLYYNDNIEQVKANELLTYNKDIDYKVSDINNSKPIENNIWFTTDSNEVVYYDRAIVGALIAFDSQWIDYVNDGERQVFDLLKIDSRAYKNAAGFSKVGKVKETFKILEIGDLRQGSNGFYAWVYEEIQIVENGTTTIKEYKWIYYLEPIEGKMKIVNYFKY